MGDFSSKITIKKKDKGKCTKMLTRSNAIRAKNGCPVIKLWYIDITNPLKIINYKYEYGYNKWKKN